MNVTVEPNDANRTLWIEADGDGMYTASEIQLNGANEKRLHQVMFKSLTRRELHAARPGALVHWRARRGDARDCGVHTGSVRDESRAARNDYLADSTRRDCAGAEGDV